MTTRKQRHDASWAPVSLQGHTPRDLTSSYQPPLVLCMLNVSMCVHVCTQVRTCMCVRARTCACVWKPEDNLGWDPQELCLSSHWSGVTNEAGPAASEHRGSSCLFLPSARTISTCHDTWHFYVSSGGIQVSMLMRQAFRSLTELSSTPLHSRR